MKRPSHMDARSIGGLCRPRNGRLSAAREITENRLPIGGNKNKFTSHQRQCLIYGIKLKWKQIYTPVW